MSLIDWFKSLFSGDATSVSISEFVGQLTTEIWYKELAIQSCINLIANVLSRAEFQTFERGKEVRKDNYYLFNVEPNINKSASKFWRDVVSRLVYNGECMVVQHNEGLYVADNFQVERFAFREYIYSGVSVDKFLLDRKYLESEVFHFEWHNEKIKTIIDNLYESYAKLIEASQKQYIRRQARRGTLTVPTNYPETEKAQAELSELMGNRFKKFFDAEGDAVLPLANGLAYEELKEAQGSQTRTSQETREIRAFIDDIFDFVAIAFNIPPQLVRGSVADTEKSMDNLLTFCVNPIAELISDEVNRKYYGKRAFLERTYVRVNTSMIRAHDIKEFAGALETLLRIGAYSIDDILKTLGMEPLGEDWSTQRFMTKNYAPVEAVIAGGDPTG